MTSDDTRRNNAGQHADITNISAGAMPAADETSAPDDFSDLIALAGVHVYDQMYHNAPGDDGLLTGHFGAGLPGAAHSELPPDAGTIDPLAALSNEYWEALLDRQHGLTHELRKAAASTMSLPPPPPGPFDDAEAPARSSLLEVLIQGRTIDSVLDELDAFDSHHLFEADRQHEVLALFAPDDTLSQRIRPTAQLAREEHHLMTVDSHLPMLHSTDTDHPSSTNPP